MVEFKDFRVPSNDGKTQLFCAKWIPDVEPKATLQISHGMVEHILRYSDFAEFLASNGYAVYGHDHLGHGQTSPDDLGFFALEHGDSLVIDDVHAVGMKIKEEYPDIPHYLLGHSMGSFIARRYITRYPQDVHGALFLGTGNQPLSSVKMGIHLANMISKTKGPRSRSDLLNKMVLTNNDQMFEEPLVVNRWMTRDLDKINEFNEDPLCKFAFTTTGFRDLFTLIRDLETKINFNRIPKDLPVIFMSGTADPIGGFGVDVVAAVDVFREYNPGVELKLYEEARHELINEINRDEVYHDILAWLDAHL